MAGLKFTPSDTEKVWYCDSNVPGPTAIILGGIHGNERAGIEVVNRLVAGEFKVPLECGRLLIALGNIAAIDANVRYTEGGTNLNREFRDSSKLETQTRAPSYEFRRAQQLMPYLRMADGALDLHGFRPKDGDPFIITEPRGFLAALAVGASYVSSGWGGKNGIEQGGTDDFMERHKKIGLCYELSQLEDLRLGVPRGEEGVLRFLEYMQLIEPMHDRSPRHSLQPTFVHATKGVLARPGFSWGPNFPYRSLQELQRGELVAQNGIAPSDRIHAAGNQVIIFPSSESNPQPGEEMFNLGTIIPNPVGQSS